MPALRYSIRHGRILVLVEEACRVSSGRLTLFQANHPDATSGDDLESLRQSLELLPVRPASEPESRDATNRGGPATWNIVYREARVRLDEIARTLKVDYRADLEHLGTRSSWCLRFVLPAPPCADIVSVVLDGRPAATVEPLRDGTVLAVFTTPVATAHDARVEICYHLDMDALNVTQQVHRRLWLDHLQLVCTAAEWLPRLDRGADLFETVADTTCPFSLQVDVPSEYRVVGTGVLHDCVIAGARAQYRFSDAGSGVPFLGFVATKATAVVTRTGSPRVVVFGASGGGPWLEAIGECLAAGAAYLARWLGEVPGCDEIAAVCYGGYECHGLGLLLLLGAIFDRPRESLDELVVGIASPREVLFHELAHLWFGGSLTGSGEERLLLHEAFAHFLAVRLHEPLCGEVRFREVLARQVAEYRAYCGHGLVPRLSRGRWHAVRGAVALHLLRDYIGEDEFDSILQEFWKRWRGGLFRLADFRAAVGSVGGRLLDTWLDETPRLPSIRLRVWNGSGPDGLTCTLHAVADQPIILRLPVFVRGGEESNACALRFEDDREARVTVALGWPVDEVFVDPHGACPVDMSVELDGAAT